MNETTIGIGIVVLFTIAFIWIVRSISSIKIEEHGEEPCDYDIQPSLPVEKPKGVQSLTDHIDKIVNEKPESVKKLTEKDIKVLERAKQRSNKKKK